MSVPASRAVLRHSRFALRRAAVRNASTTSEAAGAAKDKASQVTSKASEGLSKVTSSAGSVLVKAGSMASNTLGKVGGRTGQVIGFVQSLVPPTIYYGKVGLELGKIIFETRKMSPPSMQTFQAYLQPLMNRLKNPATLFSQTANNATPSNLLSRVRNLSPQELRSGAIIAGEVLGFFTVGQMIGRLKIVGYRSQKQHAH